MKQLREIDARRELVAAAQRLDYEDLARVYSLLLHDGSVVVTSAGDSCVHSSVYHRGRYLAEFREHFREVD
jgi:hypothetical protein